VVMVHGCFWHRHDCGLAASPKTRPEFREAKFKQQLEEAGWRVIVVWECKTFDETALGRWLRDEFGLESD
jgi:DNA mismatch endonuclease, patch repair protein